VSKGRAADNNDGFTERGINTFNDLPKHKSMQTDRIMHRDGATFASIWELHDTYATVPGTPCSLPLIDTTLFNNSFLNRCLLSHI